MRLIRSCCGCNDEWADCKCGCHGHSAELQPVPMKVLLQLHLCISFFLLNNIKMQRGKLKTQIKEPNADYIWVIISKFCSLDGSRKKALKKIIVVPKPPQPIFQREKQTYKSSVLTFSLSHGDGVKWKTGKYLSLPLKKPKLFFWVTSEAT